MEPWLQCSALLNQLMDSAFSLLSRTLLQLYTAASEPHPLLSAAAAAAVVAFLYFPRHLLALLLSPILLFTLLLLFTILHLGSSQPPPLGKLPAQPISNPPGNRLTESLPSLKSTEAEIDPLSSEPVVEWPCRGFPLEIIYEEYEGEGNEDETNSPDYSGIGLRVFERFCYSESDEESEEESPPADGCESPESICFRWDEEGDGLIEIALEEDNMIEIDISSCSRKE